MRGSRALRRGFNALYGVEKGMFEASANTIARTCEQDGARPAAKKSTQAASMGATVPAAGGSREGLPQLLPGVTQRREVKSGGRHLFTVTGFQGTCFQATFIQATRAGPTSVTRNP
jgi:hypothetical protein